MAAAGWVAEGALMESGDEDAGTAEAAVSRLVQQASVVKQVPLTSVLSPAELQQLLEVLCNMRLRVGVMRKAGRATVCLVGTAVVPGACADPEQVVVGFSDATMRLADWLVAQQAVELARADEAGLDSQFDLDI